MKSRYIVLSLLSTLLMGPLTLLEARGGHGGGGGHMHHGGGGHHGGGRHGGGRHGGGHSYHNGGYGYWSGGIWFPLAATAAVGVGLAAGAAAASNDNSVTIVEEPQQLQQPMQAVDANGRPYWRLINQTSSPLTILSDSESVRILPDDGDRLERKFSFDFTVNNMPFRTQKHVIVFYTDRSGRLNIATYNHRKDVPTLVPGAFVPQEGNDWTYKYGYKKKVRS